MSIGKLFALQGNDPGSFDQNLSCEIFWLDTGRGGRVLTTVAVITLNAGHESIALGVADRAARLIDRHLLVVNEMSRLFKQAPIVRVQLPITAGRDAGIIIGNGRAIGRGVADGSRAGY